MSPSGRGGKVLHGYYRNFGIRADVHRVQAAIVAAVDDGEVDWDDTEWHVVDPNSLDPDVQSRIQLKPGRGTWYASGRVFYSDEDGG